MEEKLLKKTTGQWKFQS